MSGRSLVGTELRVRPTRFAHGGHAVARDADGRVVFVRHALPGEDVRARITRGKEGDRFVFADAESIEVASPRRVAPPCRHAGPGGCGGCDLQHADLDYQRELKAGVVREQLARLAGIDIAPEDLVVRPVPGDEQGLRWRTRVEFAVDRAGRAGLRPFHTRDVLPLEDCLIAQERIIETGVLGRDWGGQRAVDVVAPGVGEPVVVAVPGDLRTRPEVTERVDTPRWSGDLDVDSRGFWQVHPGAAATFLECVLDGLDPQQGERALDLYAGVGLFARALADAVGPDGAVLAVESDERAVASGERDTADVEQLEWRSERVEDALAPLIDGGDVVDLVVLDPPRAGAGREVVEQIVALSPRAVAYVACDPAALGRDLRYFLDAGYALDDLVAFDAFPMTHHVECVALCRPAAGSAAGSADGSADG